MISDPVPITVEDGDIASFTIVITDTNGPYQVDWYEVTDGYVYTGVTYAFGAVLADNGDEYYAIVTDVFGTTTQTANALLTVTAADGDLYVRSPKIVTWSLADAAPNLRVVQYQPIQWSLVDGQADRDFDCPIRTHRGLYDSGRTYWIPFYDKSARCSRGPLVNDAHDRYYWTQDGQDFKYSPLADLELNTWSDGLDVGVPAPINAPTVIPPTEASDESIIVDRAYVYTYVTAYGEEGPPSPATIQSGADDGTWLVGNMDGKPEEEKNRNIISKNVYRTVTTNFGTVDYHFVGTLLVVNEDFVDGMSTTDVALNHTLESETWTPPPDNLEGLLAHPNGFFIGFVGRDLYFSEPYRPHAWPQQYVLSTLGDIIGMGIFGTTVVICTNSNPYTATGIQPAAMTLSKHDTAEPCTSRYGIVSMPFGVYYPGPNGLMLGSSAGFRNATQPLMTKEEWQNNYQISNFDAAKYQSQYVAFYDQHNGLMFAPDEPVAALVNLDLRSSQVPVERQDSIFTDEYSGNTYIFDGCDMYIWNPVSGEPLGYDWTSKEFDVPDPSNFGAGRIIWYAPYEPPSEEDTIAWRAWNTERIAVAPLNPFNYHAIGVARQETVPNTPTLAQIKQPFHGSPLFNVPLPGQPWPNTPYVILDVIVNETVVFSKEVTHTRMFRLPAGFKATRFRFRLRSNINIQSAKFAETGKELASV